MHLRLVTAAALAGLFACADRAPAQPLRWLGTAGARGYLVDDETGSCAGLPDFMCG